MSLAKKYFLICLPVLLIISTSVVFVLFSQWLGKQMGYVSGFLFYSLGWCLCVPWLLLGRQGVFSLFNERKALFSKKHWWLVIVLILTILGVLFTNLGNYSPNPSVLLIGIAIVSSSIVSVGEEILWRGLFVKAFPDNIFLGLFFPSLGYALWHFAPQLIYPDLGTGGPFSFVGYVFLLGLCYALVAYLTGSCKWTALAHSLSAILVLGGGLPPVLMALFFK